jgi:hypothetical protein
MISILLLSRKRELMLEECIDSIFKTSSTEVEIFVGCDTDDDTDYKRLHNKYSEKNVTFIYQQRGFFSIPKYLNKMAKLTKGSSIFVLNDDCIMEDTDWDLQIIDKLGDGSIPLYGKTYDDSIDRISDDYAAFPIITRSAYDKLGFFMDDSLDNHGADVITYRIYKSAKKVVDLNKVRIKHIYHNSNEALAKRQNDLTATEMINRTFSKPFSVELMLTLDISEKAKLL